MSMADVRDTWSAGRDGLDGHSQSFMYYLGFCSFFPFIYQTYQSTTIYDQSPRGMTWMPPIYFLIIDLFNEPRYPVNTSTNKYILLCFLYYLLSLLWFGWTADRSPTARLIWFSFYFSSISLFPPSFFV